jgi:transcriptional regulator with XRE-family HTH domain
MIGSVEPERGDKSPLATLREQCGKSQLQVAVDVSVTPQTVGSWERGKMPSFDKAVRLAESLNLSLDELALALGLSPPKKTEAP